MTAWAPDASVLLAALAVDVVLGEPPARWHPVVWMGALSRRLENIAPDSGRAAQLAWGSVIAVVVPSISAGVGAFVHIATHPHVPWLGWALSVWLLSSSFAIRMLWSCANEMQRTLETASLEDARSHLSHLCARDASTLESEELVAATVESVAENSSDSIVAPLFWYCVGGLPGALAYRAINTLDARIGYRGRHEWLGKIAARIDDVANWIPARIGVVALLVGGLLTRASPSMGWRVMLRDGRRTESPNAGILMATMAGMLSVQLSKAGHYSLGESHAVLTPRMIELANRILLGAAAATAVAALGVTRGLAS